ncbi:MAG: recombinase family protein [Phycisphaerales bacterium]|nr:recombinase family protein [Phycisphaerales bacterium]
MIARPGGKSPPARVRCAIYTRKSTEEGLDRDFNSLDAQRESGEAYIASQKAEGWMCLPDRYDDGGYSGGNAERPALRRLMADIGAGRIDAVVVYKVDRLSRSLLDFARMMETFEKHRISFVSVTQQFNTAQSMGRLMLNVLLSFAQFEREIISERTRDKIAAARRKGKWAGGRPVLGYDLDFKNARLQVNQAEAERVRALFQMYLDNRSLLRTTEQAARLGWTTKRWASKRGAVQGGATLNKGRLYHLLTNVLYIGMVRHNGEIHPGQQPAIVDRELFDRVQLRLRENGLSGGGECRNKHNAMLKGLLVCRPCGVAMSHSFAAKPDGRAYRYYLCGTASKQGWGACPSKSIPAEQIEAFVVDRLRAVVRDPGVLSATLDRVRQRQQERVDDLQHQLDELLARRTRLDAAIRAAVTTPVSTAELARLHEELREVELAAEDARGGVDRLSGERVTKAELDAAMGAFDGLWAGMAPAERARLVRLLVQRVEYDGGAGEVSITFRPAGIRSLEGASA